MGDSFLCRYTSYTAKSTKLKVATDLLRILVYIIICVRFTQKGGAVATGGLATCECKMTIYQKAISNIGTEILFVQSNGHKTIKKWSFWGFKNGFRKLSSSSCVFRSQNASRSPKKRHFFENVYSTLDLQVPFSADFFYTFPTLKDT